MCNDKFFNKVDNLTGICRTNSCWMKGDSPELEIGKTYVITHIGVMKSCTNIILADFPNKEYSALCFDIYENGVCLYGEYADNPAFWAPYYRKRFLERKGCRGAKRVMMGYNIPNHLSEIEKEYNVRILFAAESGSRAWGFASRDSDWDVHFIYVHEPDWHSQTGEQRDTIEYVFEDDTDAVGWELKKAISIFRLSNPTISDLLHSPIIYKKDEQFFNSMIEIVSLQFNPISAINDYYNINIAHNERFLKQEGYPMKRFLYYFRGVLACRWIEKYGTLPPVKFMELVNATVPEENIRKEIDTLIYFKTDGKECDMGEVDETLILYATMAGQYYKEYIGKYRPEVPTSQCNLKLDKLLFDCALKNSRK